jgi:putative redox protein
MKILMDYINDNTFKTQNQSNNEILIDMCDPKEKKHLSPMELLLSAITSCAAVEIVSMIKKRKRNFKNIKAETSGVRVDESPRYFSSINIKYIIFSKDLTENEAERYISLSLEKYCSVGATLNEKTQIKYSFEIVR